MLNYRYLLHIILKFKGYKNYGSLKDTGEEYFLNFLKKNKVKFCLDIGAHNGEYSKKLLQINNVEVIAFEPMKKSFMNLKKIKKKFTKQFNCFNIALSDKVGSKTIYFTNFNSQLASLSVNLKNINFLKNKKFKKQKIKVTTLDTFEKKKKKLYKKKKKIKKKKKKITTIKTFEKKNKKLFKKKIDLLKIDTEGNDFKVLKGSIKFIKKYKPKFIQIEMNYHYLFDGENLFQFHKLLKNYEIYKILPFNNGLLKIDVNRPENNIFHLSNFVFIKGF